MDESTKEERPNLCQLLEERLGALGLDAETYGPYVVGISDAEELPDVLELLKASSEDEEEPDESVWETFSQDILKAIEQDVAFQEEKKNAKKLEAQKLEQERAEKNKAAIKGSRVFQHVRNRRRENDGGSWPEQYTHPTR